jgi:hypothetical protein
MSINYVAIAKDFATWYSLAAAVLGGVIHKAWSALVGAEKKAKAEVAKLIAEAEAEVKKL